MWDHRRQHPRDGERHNIIEGRINEAPIGRRHDKAHRRTREQMKVAGDVAAGGSGWRKSVGPAALRQAYQEVEHEHAVVPFGQLH